MQPPPRDWVATCWSLSVWTVPAPFVGLLGALLPPGPAQGAVGLSLVAVASWLLVVLDLHRCGWQVPRLSLAAAVVGLGTTVAVVVPVAAAYGNDRDLVLWCVGLGLPHVALAALAWPGRLGLVQRVAVATALVAPAGGVAFVVGFPLVLLTGAVTDGTAGIVVAFALGHLLVLVGGTVVARPVALPRRPVLA